MPKRVMRKQSQNKPNQTCPEQRRMEPILQNHKMNVNLFSTKDYENQPLRTPAQNKSNLQEARTNENLFANYEDLEINKYSSRHCGET